MIQLQMVSFTFSYKLYIHTQYLILSEEDRHLLLLYQTQSVLLEQFGTEVSTKHSVTSVHVHIVMYLEIIACCC